MTPAEYLKEIYTKTTGIAVACWFILIVLCFIAIYLLVNQYNKEKEEQEKQLVKKIKKELEKESNK